MWTSTKLGGFSNSVSMTEFVFLQLQRPGLISILIPVNYFLKLLLCLYRSDRKFSRLGLTRGSGVLLVIESSVK